MKVKKLDKTEARVIAIDSNAILELLAENMTSNIETYFDLLDSRKVHLQMKWCSETNTFICAVMDANNQCELDLSSIAKDIGITTHTLFRNGKKYQPIDASRYYADNPPNKA